MCSLFSNQAIFTGMTAHESFLEANQFLKMGKYGEAQNIYESLEHKNAVVWYNLGNCYFYQKNWSKALWAWVHAYKAGDKQVVENSQYNIDATQKLLDIKNQSDYYPKANFLILQLLALLIVYGLFIFLIQTNSNKKPLQKLLFLIEIGIFGTTFWYSNQLKIVYAVVQHEANLVAGPDLHYHDLEHLAVGEIVKLLNQNTEWCYVKHRQMQGWLKKNNLLII